MPNNALSVDAEFPTSAVHPEAFRPSRVRALAWGGVVIAVVVAAAILIPSLTIGAKRGELLESAEKRLGILASGRAEVLSTWLDGMLRQTHRIGESELFRLFATEVDLAGGNLAATIPQSDTGEDNAFVALAGPLVEQLPLIERVLTDFVVSSDFQTGYLFTRDGSPYLASAGAAPSTPQHKALAAQSFESRAPAYGTVTLSAGGLGLDIAVPIFAAQTEIGEAAPVAALLLNAQISGSLGEILAAHPLAEAGENLRLVQVEGGTAVEIRPGGADPLNSLDPTYLPAGDTIAFTQRSADPDRGAAYSIGSAVSGPAWWVVQEVDAEAIDDELAGFANTAIALAALVVLAIIAVFGAFWWRLNNEHNHALADQFRRLAARIEAQKRLLDSINNSIADHIGLKALDGRYSYVNPAFAKAVGRDTETVIGMDDTALFGAGTGERLKISDSLALSSGTPVTVNEEIYLDSRLHYFQLSKVPFVGEGEEVSGIVSVTRDVTELVEQQQKKERAVQQTVLALVRAIELRDPYLAGHSRRVAGFAVATAKRLGCEAGEILTLEMAANLSQIGKLAIPRAILNKSDRLNETEIGIIEKHLDNAAAVLRDIDFELPVLETLYQMHERLDGLGYPRGLKDDDIHLTSQILGACDVFCARIEPRSYRSGIAPEEALEILEQNSARYAPTIVDALREVTVSISGEKLMAGLGQS